MDSDRLRLNGTYNPRTLMELLDRFALRTAGGLTDTCSICVTPYNTGTDPERPVVLPGCTHIFGENCLSLWMGQGENRCPTCRARILDDFPDRMVGLWDGRYPGAGTNGMANNDDPDREQAYDDESEDQGDPMDEDSSSGELGDLEGSIDGDGITIAAELENFERWRPDYHFHQAFQNPSLRATQGEALYSDLCEALVQYLEEDCTPTRWMELRYPLARMLQYTTFGAFQQELMLGRNSVIFDVFERLRNLERTSINMNLLERRVAEVVGSNPRFEFATVATYRRFAAFHDRIERVQLRLMTRLRRRLEQHQAILAGGETDNEEVPAMAEAVPEEPEEPAVDEREARIRRREEVRRREESARRRQEEEVRRSESDSDLSDPESIGSIS